MKSLKYTQGIMAERNAFTEGGIEEKKGGPARGDERKKKRLVR